MKIPAALHAGRRVHGRHRGHPLHGGALYRHRRLHSAARRLLALHPKQEASHAEQIWVNRLLATVLTIAALTSGLTSKAALVILGALATAFGFRHVRPAGGRDLGIQVSAGRCGARCSHRHGRRVSYLQGLAQPAVHALRLLGYVQRPGRGLHLPWLGFKDDEETIKRQAEVRNFLDDIDEPSEPASSGAGHEDRCAGLVFLRHRAGLYPGQQGLFLLRLSAAVVLADYLVDPGYHHDVGPVLQGRNVHHQRDPDRTGRKGNQHRYQGSLITSSRDRSWCERCANAVYYHAKDKNKAKLNNMYVTGVIVAVISFLTYVFMELIATPLLSL
jgi:hypothetical protein